MAIKDLMLINNGSITRVHVVAVVILVYSLHANEE